MKKYVLVAGTNGAGKSTLYETQDSLKDIPRVNTDDIVRSFGDWRNIADVVKAGKKALQMINDYFKDDISFSQESTLCGYSILKNIEKAKALGYKIELHYVGVESAAIAKERVAYRVAHGGHGIPGEDIERRYSESFRQLREILPMCDMAVLYDNTDSFQRFAIYQDGVLVKINDNKIPKWYSRIIGSQHER